MSTFKVNIINLNDQEAGFKFIKKMGSDFKKSRALSNKRSKVIKKMKKQLERATDQEQRQQHPQEQQMQETAQQQQATEARSGGAGVGARVRHPLRAALALRADVDAVERVVGARTLGADSSHLRKRGERVAVTRTPLKLNKFYLLNYLNN